MKRFGLWPAILFLSGCSHFGLSRPESNEPSELWSQAHVALSIPDFRQATLAFQRLTETYPETEPGRESVFYLGAIRLDPRNPEWDPAPAETLLQRYLASALAADQLPRRPEAQTLLQLAQQLNLPAEARMPGLQGDTVTKVVRERVVVPARASRELAGEVERLKREVAQRDATIAQQKEEMERIRKTLTGAGRAQE